MFRKSSKKIVCVIPARLKSTRFPGKMLAPLKNRPLLQWAWEAALRVPFFDRVVFAIDASETAAAIERFGGEYFMTSEACPTGTDRLVELWHRGVLSADIWVNWQGDEPFITPSVVADLLQSCKEDDADVWTLKKRIQEEEVIKNPNTVKVVCDEKGCALYFSRSLIPYYRDPTPKEKKCFFKHVGMYAFTAGALQKISGLTPTYLEEAEHLEQLRFLSHGLRIRVHETEGEIFGIDLPEHLAKAEQMLGNSDFLTT